MHAKNIHSLIYRNYLTSSLVPILTIEVVLLLLYFGINYYIAQQNQRTLLHEATENIREISSREVLSINQQLLAASHLSLIMQRDHEAYFSGKDNCHLPNGEPEFVMHDNGAYYKPVNKGGASLYYSSNTVLGEAELRKARCTESLDPLLVSIVETSPIITQAYLNTWDSMNRLYPFMPEAPAQYGPSLDATKYNFYYEADHEHNPDRKPVWTGAYLDPAGQGWMVSVVVPVYRGDFLEGVSGLDITLSSFIRNILNLQFPWDSATIMVDQHGMILAMQKQAEEIFGLKELGEHDYQENIRDTVQKPEEFNLLNSGNPEIRRQMKHIFDSQEHVADFTIGGVEYLVSQEIIPQTGWRMITLVDKSILFAPVTQLRLLSNRIGYIAVAVMIGFYVIFFFYLLNKSSRLASLIASPVEKLAELTRGLGANFRSQKLEPASIAEIDNLVGNFNDMATALEARTNALENAKLAAESANIAKSRFLATMSHEIRTPLNAIMSGLPILNLPDLEPAKRKKYADMITDSGNSLLTMLDNILDFSNIDTYNLALNNEAFLLAEAAARVSSIIQIKASKKDIGFAIEIDQRVPPMLYGDKNRLEQVMTSLADNAVKFTQKGGTTGIAIDVEDISDSSVVLHFKVHDTGVGISTEQQQDLFNVFSQLDDSNTREYGGTGLGLALSKKLVELMGGSIRVESEPGAGSTFHFSIPFSLNV